MAPPHVIKKIFLAIATSLFFQIGSAEECVHSREIQEYIQQNLPMSGKICASPNGFVFVKVDDGYVHQCMQFIQDTGAEEPPYFGQLYGDGAHITIIYPEESANQAECSISEVGETIQFQITGCQVLDTPYSQLFERVWVVVVDAPFLSHLREKYGFSADPLFPFHITIGAKLRQDSILPK